MRLSMVTEYELDQLHGLRRRMVQRGGGPEETAAGSLLVTAILAFEALVQEPPARPVAFIETFPPIPLPLAA